MLNLTSSDLKLKLSGLGITLSYTLIVIATSMQDWFSIDDRSFSLLATTTNTYEVYGRPEKCQTAHMINQGFLCSCENCELLIQLYQAGYVTYLCVMTSLVFYFMSMVNIQRKLWKLESREGISDSVLDSDKVFLFGPVVISLGIGY